MNVVVTIALVYMLLVVLALAFAIAAKGAGRKLARRRGESAALAVLAIAATLCAQKALTTNWLFDSYVQDAGCWVTNSTVHVAIAQRVAGIDLSGSPVLVYAREIASTNAAEWTELRPRRVFADFPADYVLENATNYDYAVYVDYVPPPTVHTNGVWQMRGIELARDDTSTTLAFPNTAVEISTPTACDYIQEGLVIFWDGLENAGWGIHDENATTWTDLTGNGYDMPLNANAIIMSNGVKVKSHVTTKGGVGMVDYSGSQDALMFDVCITWGSNSTDSRCIIANGAIANNSSRATICAKQSKYFEWSYQFRNDVVVFAYGRTLTLVAGYGKGYVNAERFVANDSDTWGFTNGKIAVGGDPRDNKYACSDSTIHSVRVYNRELTPEEIEHNNEIDRKRFNQP